MQYFWYLLLFLGRLILFPMYFLSGLFPRRAGHWVFGSWGGHRYADNSAAFFEYCQRNISDRVSLTWISRDRSIVRRLRERGQDAHWIWSPGGIVACLRADTHLYDCFVKDTNFWLSRGAKKVCLWSGVPLKVFEREIDNPKSRYYRLFHGRLYERWLLAMMMPWHVVKPDLIIATSKELADITQRSFAIPDERVSITGFPRNDRLLTDSKLPDDIDANLPRELIEAVQDELTVFLYLPTFRDSNTEYMNIDWPELDRLMQRLGARFFFKTHPMDRIKNDVHMRCIVELPQELDVYNVLPYTDALISDYSSIIFDYMLLQRPIIYYTPDLASFIDGSRSLNFDPSEIAIGPICSTFEQLMGALEDVVTSNSDQYSDVRKVTIPRIYKHLDARACERVLAAIEGRQV